MENHQRQTKLRKAPVDGMIKTAILGTEFDHELRTRLAEKLKTLGAKTLPSHWWVVGSQEFHSLPVSLNNQVLIIETETYMGLSISGPDELVDEIASCVGAL